MASSTTNNPKFFFSRAQIAKALKEKREHPNNISNDNATILKNLKIDGSNDENQKRASEINLKILAKKLDGMVVFSNGDAKELAGEIYYSMMAEHPNVIGSIAREDPEQEVTDGTPEEMEAELLRQKKGNDSFRTGNEPIKSIAEFKKNLSSNTFTVDQKLIAEHLTRFLESVTVEDEGYLSGEIKVKYYKEASPDMYMLIGAGTKVLDALMYVALFSKAECRDIFSLEEIVNLAPMVISKNVTISKRAIQAAAVLVYIQGSLPKESDASKPVPKFIKENLYKGEIGTLGEIGKHLSCTNTSKFPARVFLSVDITKFTDPVATRCKLGVAGNRAIRYAIFAGSCEKSVQLAVREDDKGPEVLRKTQLNEQIKKSIEIADFLRSLAGNTAAQLKLHPLSPNRPIVKNFTKKMTRAIIESLSYNGRVSLYNKIESTNNNAFKNDISFSGEMIGEERVWKIMTDAEADYSDISVASLKGIYGIN